MGEKLGCDCTGNFPEWYVDDVNYFPQQGKGCDCGIFTFMFAILLYVYQPLYFDKQFIHGQE